MGRKALFTKKEFVRAYKKANTAKKLAKALSITIATVHNYIKRHSLKPYLEGRFRESSVSPTKLASWYRYNVTIADIGKKFSLSPTTIRHHLSKFILCPDRYKLSSKLSPPKKVSHIKVINALIKDPAAIDDPRRLLSLPGLSRTLINDYWRGATGWSLEDYK